MGMVTLPLICNRLYHMGKSFLLTAHMDCSAVKTITMGLCLLENHPACTSVVNCLYDYQKDTAGFFVQSWKGVRNNFYTYIFDRELRFAHGLRNSFFFFRNTKYPFPQFELYFVMCQFFLDMFGIDKS